MRQGSGILRTRGGKALGGGVEQRDALEAPVEGPGQHWFQSVAQEREGG